MALGKAIVTTDLPGIRDALGVPPAGIHVRPGDAEDLARTLLKVLCDKSMRTALGEANRLRAAEQFSIQRISDEYLDLIGDALPNPAPVAAGSANFYTDADRT
jgi:glycosyltransferase involved in cell wall biosynthesis